MTAALIASPSGSDADRAEEATEAVVGGDARGGELLAVLLEEGREERLHDVAEDDRVGDLHHGGLEVHREEHVVGLGAGDLLGEEAAQRGDVHERAVDDLAGQHLEAVLEDGLGAVGGDVLDGQGVVVGDHDRQLVGEEVVLAHGGDAGLRVRAPLAHPVGVRLRVVLDRERRTTVGVALAQHRVDRGTLDLVVLRDDGLLLGALRVLRVVGEVVALLLQLLDRGLELRDRGGHVGQLDDVGLGRLGQGAELGEGVVDDAEDAEDPTGERDVAGLDVDAGLGGVRLHDREEGVRRQQRRLVRVRVDDLGHARRLLRLRECGWAADWIP